MSNCNNIETLDIPIQPPSGRGVFIKQGDTIPKIQLVFDIVGLDLTTSTVKMQVYNGSKPFIDITNGEGITIISSTELEIDEVPNNTYPVGKFIGDLQITEADGNTYTYFNVQYTIIKQYTR